MAYELRLYLAAVALTFLVTLAVFPGIASSVCSQHSTAAAPPCTPHPPAGRFYGACVCPCSLSPDNVLTSLYLYQSSSWRYSPALPRLCAYKRSTAAAPPCTILASASCYYNAYSW